MGNEYQDAAFAMLSGNAEGSPSPAEGEQVAESAPVEGSPGVESAAPPAPEGEPEAVKEESPVAKNLAAVAREKAELRKQREELEHAQRDTAKLMTAVKAKDPLALLAAAGFSYQQLVEQVISGKVTSENTPDDGAAPKEWASRVEALENQIKQERATRARVEALSTVKDLAVKGGDKYALMREQGAENQALAYLEDYYSKTGEMPAETFEESIAVAMEAVEADLNKELERWLTTSKARARMGSAAPAKGTAGQTEGTGSKVVKTLTNGMASPTKHVAPPEPKSAEDYRRLALAMLDGKQS